MASFFHPKTGNEIAPSTEYIKVLNSTAQEVRKILLDESGAPIMPENIKTLYDLLFQVILNKDIPVNQILNMRHPTSTRDLRPQTFEGMWRIAFALGVVPGYENVTIYNGKVEEGLQGKDIKRNNVLDYLKKRDIATSRIDGASDISFSIGEIEEIQSECSSEPLMKRVKQQRNFGFCSAKYYRNDAKKSVDQYDVTNIISAALAGKYDASEFRVLLLTNNKAAVKDTFAMAMRRYITYIVKDDDMHRGILGRDDLEAAFTRLRDQSRVYPDLNMFIQNTFLGVKGPRPFLSLRFHQELVVKKTLEIMKDESRSSVLWGVVARGGKTYIAGGLIRDVRPRVVFIVAGAYTETHTQFIDDLLDVKKKGFQDFADYEVVDVKDETSWGPAYDKNKRYIYFLSLELLKLTDTKAKTRTVMKQVSNGEIPIDLVFFDEIHKGGTTDLADKAVNLLGEKAFKVFMTATYIKPFIKPEYKLDPGNLITWGYEDIMTAKAMDSPDTVKYFGNKYGQEICQSVLDYQSQRGISTTDIAAQYQKFPEIQFLSTAFSEEFEENMIQQNVIDPKSGFKMGSLLHIGKECMTIPFNKRYECFSSPATVGLFLNFMGPANKQLEKLPNGSKVVLLKSPDEHITDRIGRTSQRRGDRLKNLEKEFKPHSQLWFLPQASGNGTNDKPLLSMMTCLASMIVQHPWFYKNFCIVCVSSGFGSNNKDEPYEDGKGFIRFTNGGNDTKKTVIDAEIAAREQGRGLIILAGRMLTLGVSLPCVNVVALLDDSSSSDLTYQKMFRALTESEGKTIGYVVDVNPIRTLKTLYDYTTIEQDESNSNKAHEPVTITTLTNLYLFDEDRLFVINEDGTRLTGDGLHKRLDEYLQKSRKVYKTILAEATANIADVKTLLAEEFGILKDALKRSKPEVLGIVQDLVGLELPSGMERIADAPPDAKVPKPVDKKTAQDEADRLRSLREILLTSMTLLAFFTTETDLPNAFERYKNNDDQLQDIIYKTVVDRGLVTESVDKETMKNVITSSMMKVMTKLIKPYNNMRTQFSEFTGDQRDVVQFIEENLMPKKEQKDARGEVFTPLELVDDMLAHLPEDVWKHPEYKWLDPANGIGNFPVVAFAKLDVGLAEAIPNEAERRKHIVENMLYMCELDSTNVELSKKLLQKMCGDVNCKLNVIQGDFLTLTYNDIKSKFGGVFNVCMGNPPYNPSKIETGSSGNSIWQNFIMKMETLLEPNGYMCVVHPPGWKKPTEDMYKPEKFKGGIFKGQIRQGQVWQYLKTRGSFTYIYTNDQKTKAPEYWANFPAVDYYVFQKDSDTTQCKTRNVFCGKEYLSEVSLNKQLPYLPCIMTQETVDILDKVISKEGRKLKFKPGVDPRSFNGKIKGEIKYIYDAGVRGPNYAFYTEKADNVDKSKIVINENGGIDGYYAKFIDASEQIGVLHHTMIQVLEPTDDGKYIEGFLNSDIVKFLFLITQYTSGKMTTNEKGVANSITIPPNDVTDYYEFFGIQHYKPFIEKLLTDYNVFKAPKRKVEEGVVAATPRKRGKARNTTRRSSKTDSVSSNV